MAVKIVDDSKFWRGESISNMAAAANLAYTTVYNYTYEDRTALLEKIPGTGYAPKKGESPKKIVAADYKYRSEKAATKFWSLATANQKKNSKDPIHMPQWYADQLTIAALDEANRPRHRAGAKCPEGHIPFSRLHNGEIYKFENGTAYYVKVRDSEHLILVSSVHKFNCVPQLYAPPTRPNTAFVKVVGRSLYEWFRMGQAANQAEPTSAQETNTSEETPQEGPTSEDLVSKIELLESELAAAQELMPEYKELKEQLATWKESFEAEASKHATFVAETNAQILKLKEENERLLKASDSGDIKALQRRLQEKSTTIADLKGYLSASKKRRREVEDALEAERALTKALQDQLATVSKEDEERSEKLRKYASRIRSLKRELEEKDTGGSINEELQTQMEGWRKLYQELKEATLKAESSRIVAEKSRNTLRALVGV